MLRALCKVAWAEPITCMNESAQCCNCGVRCGLQVIYQANVQLDPHESSFCAQISLADADCKYCRVSQASH